MPRWQRVAICVSDFERGDWSANPRSKAMPRLSTRELASLARVHPLPHPPVDESIARIKQILSE
jgi:hypothetical protein